MRTIEQSKEIIEREGQDANLRYPLVIQTGQKIFDDTALTLNRPWSERDVLATRQFLVEVAPFAHPKVNPSYWEHLVISSIYSRKIAEKAGRDDFNPYESETLLLLHDLGRVVVPHRYLRTDFIEHRLFERIGIRTDLEQKLPSMNRILGLSNPDQTFQSIDDIPQLQILTQLPDNIGKKGSEGNLINVKSLADYVSSQLGKYTGEVWPSENRGKYALNEEGKQAKAIELLLDEIRWAEREYRIDFDQLREEVTQEFMLSENQAFLFRLRDAQESLDPAIDTLLRRPPIRKVVFDIGNVLLGGPGGVDIDLALAEGLARELYCSSEEAYKSLLESVTDEAMSGRMSEEEYLTEFWYRSGKKPPLTLDAMRRPFIQPQIYSPIEEMQDIVEHLSRNPSIEIHCLTDSIAAVTPTVLQALQTYYPQIKLENIYVSNRQGAAKREKEGPAFRVLFERLGNPDPQTVLFIDDKEPYTATFRSIYGGRGFTFRGNPYQGLNSSQRLKSELQRGGYI